MTAAQFLGRLKRNEIAPAYLFLGSEMYERGRCRQALRDAVVGEAVEGFAQYDVTEADLAAIVDDARSLSLFASQRLIVAVNAEAALPRTRPDDDGEDIEGARSTANVLHEYLKDPSPGVTLLFESTRYDFDSADDKKKLERVRKFYSAIADVVELRPYSAAEAHRESQALAREAGIRLEPSALDLLIEALGSDIARIAGEIEKLSLFAGPDRAITVDDIVLLVPDARSTSIFALVNALGRRDRSRSLEILDTLSRSGEYLPLALAFLSTQFRLALVAQETNLRTPQQIQSYFSRAGLPMWQSRAQQIYQTVSKFSRAHITRALKLIYEADQGLRDTRPDDRVVMERFILRLTNTSA